MHVTWRNNAGNSEVRRVTPRERVKPHSKVPHPGRSLTYLTLPSCCLSSVALTAPISRRGYTLYHII